MKKILITGGSGFIGTNFINYLDTKNKFKIYNIDKISSVSTPEKFKRINNKKKYQFIKLNLINFLNLKKCIKKIKPDIIVHMAAESHVDRSIDNPEKFYFENIKSTQNILNAIRLQKNKMKFIYFSTDEVFGSYKKGKANEKKNFETNSPYSASKASCENLINSYISTFNLDCIIIRLSNNYGPYQYPEKLLPNILNKLKNNKKIELYGKGKNEREWIFVRDTCEALYKLIIEKKIYSDSYNVGSGKTFSNIDIVKKVLNQLKKKPYNEYYKFIKDRPGHDERYCLDSRKFKKKFRWKPKFNLNTGLKQTLSWYENNYKWLKYIKTNFKDKRIGTIKK